jgi:hypothetical protein
MSVTQAESELRRARTTLEDARKKQAVEEKKVADAEKAAASKEQSAARTSSTSSQQSYRREAERKRADANQARSRAADYSTKAAAAQVKVHQAEEKLAKARAAVEKKRDDDAKRARAKQDTEAKRERSRQESDARRERQQREADERRQREQAASMARQARFEQERAEQARLAQDAARDEALAEVGAEIATTRAVLDSRPWENAPEKITVLLMTAEPDGVGRLRIDRELREIREQVRSSELRDSINFEFRPATRITDVLQHLNEVQPDVVHFSGHGADAGIALHDANDSLRLLTNEEIGKLLALSPKPLKLVVFNSCDSAAQARVAVQHATAAIGMEQSIEDETARVFAGQLYNSLGFGRSLGLAFEQAKFQVEITFNALSGDPALVMADGVDANEFVVVSPAD